MQYVDPKSEQLYFWNETWKDGFFVANAEAKGWCRFLAPPSPEDTHKRNERAWWWHDASKEWFFEDSGSHADSATEHAASVIEHVAGAV